MIALACAMARVASAAPDPTSGTVDCKNVDQSGFAQLVEDMRDLYCFEGYISRFSPWPVLESGDRRPWGIPQWSMHVVKPRKAGAPVAEGKSRPRAWFTIPELNKKGIAPKHEDYQFSSAFRKGSPNWYDRGHLTQKYLAERAGGTAGWFTHNMVNAVPQRSIFNSGAWQALECYTGAWANESAEVWIVTGPVFVSGEPKDWLESDSRRVKFPIAIPDFLFKVVARPGVEGWEAMGFLYPQEDSFYKKAPWTPARQLVPIERIEWLTGLKFADGVHPAGKTKAAKGRIWPVKKSSFDAACKKFSEDVR